MNKTLTITTIALVAVIMGMSFGIVQAMGPGVTEHVGAVLKLQQNGNDVDVEVKAQGLASSASFTVRTYTVTNCGPGLLAGIGTASSDSKGNLAISGTISSDVVNSVNSVSIRSAGSPATNPPVVCFQNTTP